MVVTATQTSKIMHHETLAYVKALATLVLDGESNFDGLKRWNPELFRLKLY